MLDTPTSCPSYIIGRLQYFDVSRVEICAQNYTMCAPNTQKIQMLAPSTCKTMFLHMQAHVDNSGHAIL